MQKLVATSSSFIFAGLIPLAADIPASSAQKYFLIQDNDQEDLWFLGAGLVGANEFHITFHFK